MQTFGADAQGSRVSRSFLFVPGDSERKLAKAAESDADAIIIDLEDAVAASERPAARRLVADFLAEPVRQDCWVRINGLSEPDSRPDLEAIVPGAPYGVVLPKCNGAADLIALSSALDELERSSGDDKGVTRILPIATEHPEALFRLHEYKGVSTRLDGLTWGAVDLSAAVGAVTNRDADGRWLPPYELARSLCLFGACAAGVSAIDTVFTDIRDTRGLTEYACNARRDGFTGMLAIHPAQLGPINDAFVPSPDDVARARRVIDAFAQNPGIGVMSLDGEMIDRPHLEQARRILDVATRAGAT